MTQDSEPPLSHMAACTCLSRVHRSVIQTTGSSSSYKPKRTYWTHSTSYLQRCSTLSKRSQPQIPLSPQKSSPPLTSFLRCRPYPLLQDVQTIKRQRRSSTAACSRTTST